MRMSGATVVAGVAVVLLATGASRKALFAQQWNDPRALGLVRQASDRRAQQLADSGLVDYTATAHGYLTFLAQMGEGFGEPPQVVKADELALQVYWRAPNHSKQRIVGRRDTTLLPTDIDYHRDHLGIVQNNFPAIIRLGDGDEVKDVPHPLSDAGLSLYDFAITDSLRISIPGRAINVYEVKVRPRDDREARVIGALYLDRETAQVVRMALSFTRAAFKDKLLEDLFVVLENGLVGTRFWLPRRQEIEIRRTGTWLELPVRGIIRGRWEIAEYELNVGLNTNVFLGPEIVQVPAQQLRAYQWQTRRILDSLPPDVRATTAEEIRRVQTEVRALVREQALRRARGGGLAGRGASDFVRFNRVEGLSLGGGVSARLGGGLRLAATGRYGLDDERAKARVEVAWHDARGREFALRASDDFRDVGDVAERSGIANSVAAQEFGSDYSDPFRVRRVAGATRFPLRGSTLMLDVARERHEPLGVNAVPATGRFSSPPQVDSVRAWRVTWSLSRPTGMSLAGTELRYDVVATWTRPDSADPVIRWFGHVDLQRPVGDLRLLSRTHVAATERGTPLPQDVVTYGGPISGPGYRYHSLADDAGFSQRIELRAPVPFPAFSLGRFGRSAAAATIAPYGHVVGLRRSGLYPSAGLGLYLFFDLLRLDVARGLRDGAWTWSLDVTGAYWSIL